MILPILLTRYITNNKEADNDWFRLESNKEGTRWFGKCWHYHNQVSKKCLLMRISLETSVAEIWIWRGVWHSCDLPNNKPGDCPAWVGWEDSKGGKRLFTCMDKYLHPLPCSDVQRGKDLPHRPLQASVGQKCSQIWQVNLNSWTNHYCYCLQVLLMQWLLAWDPGWQSRYQTW